MIRVDPSWSESNFILFFYSIRPGLAVRVDPVRLLYLPVVDYFSHLRRYMKKMARSSMFVTQSNEIVKENLQKRHIKGKGLEHGSWHPLEKHFEHFLSGGARKI